MKTILMQSNPVCLGVFLAVFCGSCLITPSASSDELFRQADPFTGKPVVVIDGVQKLRDPKATKLDASYASKAYQRIAGELKTTTSMSFVNEPLPKVLRAISDAHQIPIAVNQRALKESNIDPESPVSIDIRNVYLRSALKMLLAKLQLTYITKEDVLQITTEADALQSPIRIVYALGWDDAQNRELIDRLRESLESIHRDPMPRPELNLVEPSDADQQMQVSVVANQRMHKDVGDAVRKIHEAAESDLERLQGEWEMIDGQTNGQPMADVLKKKGATELRISFVGNLMKMTGPQGRDFVYAFKLDPGQNPKTINSTPQNPEGQKQNGPELLGIYGVQGDDAVLCLANGPSVDRPEKFAAPKGSRATFLQLKRAAR